MANRRQLMAGGLSPMAANMLGMTIDTSLAAQGTTQAAAQPIITNLVVFTTVTSTARAAILPGQSDIGMVWVVNSGTVPLSVFPPVGANINGQADDTAVTIAPWSAGIFHQINRTWAFVHGG